MSAAYSLPHWWSLQFCLVTEKYRLRNTILGRGKVLHGTTAEVVYLSQGTQWSLETARSRAWGLSILMLDTAQHLPDLSQQTSVVSDERCFRRPLFQFHTCPQPSPCAFSPAPSSHIWLSPTSLTGRCFFHHPTNPMCKNSLILLFDSTFFSQAENNF